MPLELLKIKKEYLSNLNIFTSQVEPLEACALLLGKIKDNQIIVLEIVPLNNEYSSEIRFKINETELLKVYRYAESRDLSIVGIYHSHPSYPFPSNTDMEYMKINPIPWIIKSTITKEIKCYIHDEDFQIKEIKICIMD